MYLNVSLRFQNIKQLKNNRNNSISNAYTIWFTSIDKDFFYLFQKVLKNK